MYARARPIPTIIAAAAALRSSAARVQASDPIRALARGRAAPCAAVISGCVLPCPDGSDFGPLVTTSGACGFVPKAELSGERVQELLGQ